MSVKQIRNWTADVGEDDSITQYIFVRKQESENVVAKFDVAGETLVKIPDTCEAEPAGDKETFRAQTIDQSELSQTERVIIGYP